MDNLNAFDIFNEFFSTHPFVQSAEILHLTEPLRYYHCLNGKTLNDITVAMKNDYKQVYKIASELEIFRYSDHSLPKQRELIFEKFNTIFSKRKLCNEDIKPMNETKQEEKDEQKEEKKEEEKKEIETKRKRKENPEGYVYVFSNVMYAHYGDNVYKIGYSGDAEERVHDFDTGYPELVNIVYTFKHVNARCLEQRVHKALDMFRLFPNREFFKCALPVIKAMIEYLASTM